LRALGRVMIADGCAMVAGPFFNGCAMVAVWLRKCATGMVAEEFAQPCRVDRTDTHNPLDCPCHVIIARDPIGGDKVSAMFGEEGPGTMLFGFDVD